MTGLPGYAGPQPMPGHFALSKTQLEAFVHDVVKAIGTTGDARHKLGFTVGPLCFDMSDEETRQFIHDSFAVARENDVAVAFHIDDSMCWGERKDLLSNPDNIETADWKQEPNTGRRADWGPEPTRFPPQMCFNSPDIQAAVKERASLIGAEVKKEMDTLKTSGKEHLFAGVIAGWETYIGRDFETDRPLGYELDFGEPAYSVLATPTPEPDTTVLRYNYTSLTTPTSVFDYDMNTRHKTLRKQQPVLGDFDPANYVTERLTATARDGTEVPISVVYRKGITRSGKNPCLLYGYGSYGFTSEPTFRLELLTLVDRGFVFAIAHIRGGQELGRQWYEDGKLLKKKNTFTDFIDCAEFLINDRLADPHRLFAKGGSAGGLTHGRCDQHAT